MFVRDLYEEPVIEKQVWARSGKKVVRKYRCTTGRRKGRVVATASQCSAPINMKKRLTLKRNKAKFGGRMARKSQRTKKFSSASRRLRMLNR